MRFIIQISLLILSFQVLFGQETPKVVLFNESGIIDCCDSTFDNFLNELNRTNAVGYVVIYKNQQNPLESYYYEVAIKSHFFARDTKNINFIQGKSGEKTRTEMWLVPNDAEKPEFDEEKWDYKFQDKTKPFAFYSNSGVDGICMFFVDMYFQNILGGNKNANIDVVIFSNTQKRFLKKRFEIQNDLVKNYDIEKSRLRFIRKPKTNYVYQEAEYWLVPKKRK